MLVTPRLCGNALHESKFCSVLVGPCCRCLTPPCSFQAAYTSLAGPHESLTGCAAKKLVWNREDWTVEADYHSSLAIKKTPPPLDRSGSLRAADHPARRNRLRGQGDSLSESLSGLHRHLALGELGKDIFSPPKNLFPDGAVLLWVPYCQTAARTLRSASARAE